MAIAPQKHTHVRGAVMILFIFLCAQRQRSPSRRLRRVVVERLVGCRFVPIFGINLRRQRHGQPPKGIFGIPAPEL
jgi:hypothetical protein